MCVILGLPLYSTLTSLVSLLKGTVSVISSDSQSKDGNAYFSTVSLDIYIFVYLDCFFHLWFLSKSDKRISCLQETNKEIIKS